LDFGSLGYLLDPAGLLTDLLGHMGAWVYAIIFLIIFAETGLVIAPFLPGDSLLFAAGALAGTGRLELWVVVVIVIGHRRASGADHQAPTHRGGGSLLRAARGQSDSLGPLRASGANLRALCGRHEQDASPTVLVF
jgi:hypothetical protein